MKYNKVSNDDGYIYICEKYNTVSNDDGCISNTSGNWYSPSTRVAKMQLWTFCVSKKNRSLIIIDLYILNPFPTLCQKEQTEKEGFITLERTYDMF